MLAFLGRRILISIPTIILISMFVFGIQKLLPGDPVLVMAGEERDPQVIEFLREKYHLNDPIPVQYLSWIGNAARGDLGISLRTNQPVLVLIGQKLPVTIQLAVMALIVALFIGIPAGVLSAYKKGTWVDWLANIVALSGLSIPNFWLGIMLILLVSVNLGWLPASGYRSPTEDFWLSIKTMLMPAFVLGTSNSSSDDPAIPRSFSGTARPVIAARRMISACAGDRAATPFSARRISRAFSRASARWNALSTYTKAKFFTICGFVSSQYSVTNAVSGSFMEGCAVRRLLTCAKICMVFFCEDANCDPICSTTRGVNTCNTRSSFASSVNPRAVSALSSAASSSASLAGAIGAAAERSTSPPRFRFRGGDSVPTGPEIRDLFGNVCNHRSTGPGIARDHLGGTFGSAQREEWNRCVRCAVCGTACEGHTESDGVMTTTLDLKKKGHR